MKAEIVTTKDSAWTRMLELVPHDVYHTPQYLEFSARHEQGDAMAFFAEDEDGAMLIPFLIRRLPEALGAPREWRDISSPYGYASPLFLSKRQGATDGRYLERFFALAAEMEIVSGFIRFHPMLAFPRQEFASRGMLVKHGETVNIDLTLEEGQAWRQMRENHRKGIKRLIALGFKAEMDNWEFWESFVRIYRETMTRVGASSFYLFSDAYFSELRAKQGESVHLCSVVSEEGELAAAGLFFTTGEFVEFHLSGTAEEFVSFAPSKLMFHHVRCWACTRGYSSLHIGGGVGSKRDSLFKFKVGFSKNIRDFYTYRAVFCPKKYAELTASVANDGTEAPSLSEFFPGYRVTR